MLVGFCILNKDKKIDHLRFFSDEVKCIKKTLGNNIIHLYGYGSEYEISVEKKTYSLYQNGLNRRNIYVRISSGHVEFKSDWLGSFPCYYDEVSKEVASHWGMLDLQSRESDPVASYILKKYSFIPTARTLKKGIRRMLSNQTLVWNPYEIKCRTHHSTLNHRASTQPNDIVQHISTILKRDNLEESEVIIPLSGGFDSRFLASIIKNELAQTFRSFTYSLLGSCGDCFESKVSKVVAQKLNSPWCSFDLTGYVHFEQTIIDWSGGFSHINGDYYEMFAEQVKQDSITSQDKQPLVVSGIIGDLWCGKVSANYHSNLCTSDILYSHGISTYSWLINTKEKNISKQAEDELNKFFSKRICSNETLLLEMARAKVPLLSFLCYSFERRGIRCSAPFLDKTIVDTVLSLDSRQRQHRRWQDDYFRSLGLSDDQLPSIFFKINRLAIDEGAKKQFESFKDLRLPAWKIALLQLLLSKPVRLVERILTRHKITEYILRKSNYRRSDILISILNVLTK